MKRGMHEQLQRWSSLRWTMVFPLVASTGLIATLMHGRMAREADAPQASAAERKHLLPYGLAIHGGARTLRMPGWEERCDTDEPATPSPAIGQEMTGIAGDVLMHRTSAPCTLLITIERH
jgi:hypothetical protein